MKKLPSRKRDWIASANKNWDILEDDLIQIFKPIHIVQKWLGFQRVQVKHNFVTGASTLCQLYAAFVIFLNIVCIVDVVLNCETVMKVKFTDESLKLALILNAFITNIVIWRNNFVNGSLNSMLYVKLQRLDRNLKMSDRRSHNRKLALISLYLSMQTVLGAAAWIVSFNLLTMKQFYPTTIFAMAPVVGNYVEIILCGILLIFLSKRVDYVNKLLEDIKISNTKSLPNSKNIGSWSKSDTLTDKRTSIVLAMHNILDILFDFIKLFQFEIFGFICQFIAWIFISMRNFVNSIKEQTSVDTDMIICSLPLTLVMVVMIISISVIGGALTSKLETSRKLCMDVSSYCEGPTREAAKQLLSMMLQNKFHVSIYSIFELNNQLPLTLFVVTANYAIVFLQFAML